MERVAHGMVNYQNNSSLSNLRLFPSFTAAQPE